MENSNNINYKGIRPKELIWVTHFDLNHNLSYCVTSDSYRNIYYLYKFDIKNSIWIRTKYKSEDPTTFQSVMCNSASVRLDTEKIKEISEVNSTEMIKSRRGRPPKNKLF